MSILLILSNFLDVTQQKQYRPIIKIMKEIKRPEIAVIGMAGRFPGANNIDEYWGNLKTGKETLPVFSDQYFLLASLNPQFLKTARYLKFKLIFVHRDFVY